MFTTSAIASATTKIRTKITANQQQQQQITGKAINIDYGNIDFENVNIETVTSTRL